MASRLRLMTHNIWNRDKNSPQWEEKGFDCSAAARAPGLLRVYRETKPDVIGCQEASALMADLLKEGFAAEGVNYTLIWGRFTPIFYRPDRLELIDSEFGSYPETIDGLEGSFNDVRSKSWNIAALLYADTPPNASNVQKGSDKAREIQLASLTAKIASYCEKYDCPAFLVGDLNTGYRSAAVQSAFGAGFSHAHDIAAEFAEEAVGYHYCFPAGFETEYYDRPFETAIDHILVRGAAPGTVKRFERYSPEYYYPISDHSAVFADVEL